jgi:hypothetical protein
VLTLVLVAALTVAAAADDDVGASSAPVLVLVLDLTVAATADGGSTDANGDVGASVALVAVECQDSFR